MAKQYYVYILSNKRKGTLYIGVTSNLIKRIEQHKNKEIEGFSKKYSLDRLVYYEHTNSIEGALNREKQLKRWNRNWKINLIVKDNPDWQDLSNEVYVDPQPSWG
jgi:putative endonuclease